MAKKLKGRISTGKSTIQAKSLNIPTNLTLGQVSDANDLIVLDLNTDEGAKLLKILEENNLTIKGGEGLTTSLDLENNTITITLNQAGTDSFGGSSFDPLYFSVTDGIVSLNPGGINTTQLADSTVIIGTTEVSLGGSIDTIQGLKLLEVDEIIVGAGSKISSEGSLDVDNSRIINVAEPINPTDAANKAYVDKAAQGLNVRPAVHVATTEDLGGVYTNGDSGVGATIELPASESLVIDGHTDWEIGYGILVKDQSVEAENGRYIVSQIGDIETPWILTRCEYCDDPSEIPSSYVYVQEGLSNASTGWVANVEDFDSFDVGVDAVIFDQFSGAGTYTAGEGLSIVESTFNVNPGPGIKVESDLVQLDDSVSGQGLIYANGTISVVGSPNRISVYNDSIDISPNYSGQTSITTLGTVNTGTWEADPIQTEYGGTGVTSYSKGDILFASSENTLEKLPVGNPGNVMMVSDSGTPYWSATIDGGTF